MALESQSYFWILFFALMLANIAHDMVVCVRPMLPKCSVPAIATAGPEWDIRSPASSAAVLRRSLPLWSPIRRLWHSVAIHLTVGCLLSALTAMLIKPCRHGDEPLAELP